MYCYSCFLCIVYNCCIVYRIFLLSCISVTGHFHYMFFHYEAFPLRGFPLRGTFESDFSIFSIHCVGVTCMFYCTPFSGCFRGGHVCFSFSSFSHFLRFSHIISSSPMFLKSEATEALIRGKDHPIRSEPKATRADGEVVSFFWTREGVTFGHCFCIIRT